MFFPPVALIKMGLSGCTKVEQQLCQGDGGLVQAVLARVYLTENERLRQNISIRGPL